MSAIEKILLCQYYIPMLIGMMVVFFVEKKSKTFPSRDNDEFVGRICTGLCAMIVFSFIQAIIRTSNL